MQPILLPHTPFHPCSNTYRDFFLIGVQMLIFLLQS